MLHFIQLIVVLLTTVAITAAFASFAWELVASFFNLRGKFLKKHLDAALKHQNLSAPRSKEILEVLNAQHCDNVKGSSLLFNASKRFPEHIDEQVILNCLKAENSTEEVSIDKDLLRVSLNKMSDDYKGKVKKYLFFPGLVIAILFNVDLFHITDHYKESPELLAETYKSIQANIDELEKVEFGKGKDQTPEERESQKDISETIDELKEAAKIYEAKLDELAIPIGWGWFDAEEKKKEQEKEEKKKKEEEQKEKKDALIAWQRDSLAYADFFKMWFKREKLDARLKSEKGDLKFDTIFSDKVFSDNSQIKKEDRDQFVDSTYAFMLAYHKDFAMNDALKEKLEAIYKNLEVKEKKKSKPKPEPDPEKEAKKEPIDWGQKVGAFVLLGMLCMMGGPFWFDLIKKILR